MMERPHMDYENEPWRRLYIRESEADRKLPVFSRALLDHLLRHVDEDRVIFRRTKDPGHDLARALGAHEDEFEAVVSSVRQLIASGHLSHEGKALRLNPRETDRPTWDKSSYPEVYKRDGEECRYCSGSENLSIDHVIPRCQGGTDHASNLVVCCRSCNSRKGGRTPGQAGMQLRAAQFVTDSGTSPTDTSSSASSALSQEAST